MHAGSTALLLTVPLESAGQYGGSASGDGGEVGSGGGDVSQGLAVAVPPLVAAAFVHLMSRAPNPKNEDARLGSASSEQRMSSDSDGDILESQGGPPGATSATDASSADLATMEAPTDHAIDHATHGPTRTLTFREVLQERMAIHFHAHDYETLNLDAESLDHAWSKLTAVSSS